ncbi:LacI family DNA-binding transcriptional regulator [Bifidobacterium callitrichidarum]|uniref:LacI family transcriptional regulator n=1 Tax=Bifidobacterium callitrichidarum TaxID=2052941 RepID=A0A2U2N726_9BIFI|nr:LacI family DNA-binding transcriptional regulator [Bifidobacterium callitrichidarum]PWG65001.1 LacI family transcriptional regulator [Bifidobacterium callitrichidarum]
MEGDAVTIRDVAKLAGVAVSTASRALGNGSASAKTRLKVQQAAEALHFVPNQAAKQLTSGKSNIVAIVATEEPDFVFHDAFISGVVSQLATSFASAHLLPFLVLTQPHDAKGFLKLLNGSGAAGAVIVSFHYTKTFADAVKEYGKPVVFVGHPHVSMHYPYVDVDSYQGGYAAGELFAKHGRKRIAIVEGPTDMLTPQLRTEGIVDAARQFGCEIIGTVPGEYSIEHGERGMREILEKHPEVDAVFAHSDDIAAGVYRTLHTAGKRVPEDVSVIGFDNFQTAGVLNPGLTTLAQPLPAMAEAATGMLVERLETGEWKRRAVLFPARLVERESV